MRKVSKNTGDMKYKKGEKIICEKCGEKSEEPVEDFVVPGLTGPSSIEDDMCGYCDWEFTVEALPDGTYDVEGS